MPELPPRCVPCRAGAPALDPTQAEALRREHALSWTLADGRIRRAFVLRDFVRALAWLARVGELAEEEGHHPDLHLTRWKHVELVLWTHAVGGLSLNDFVLARRIDAAWASCERTAGSTDPP